MKRAREAWIRAAALAAAGVTAACSPSADAPPERPEQTGEAPAALTGSQEAKLTYSGGQAGHQLGWSADVSGDTAILGSFGTSYAAVFVRSGGSWTEQDMLPVTTAPCSVAVDGDTALVGERGGNAGKGMVRVFTRKGANWTEEAPITPNVADEGQFGHAVAFRGDTAVIGAKTANASGGKALVYDRSGGPWAKTATLTGAMNDKACGSSVALSGGTVLFGCPGSGTDDGSAHVYVKDGGGSWMFEERLVGSEMDPQLVQLVGSSVALSGDIAALGSSSGIYVLKRSGTTWTHEKKIAAVFGPALSGDALIGSKGGAWRVFLRDGGAWTEAASGTVEANLSETAVDGSTVLLGSQADSGNKGAGYILSLQIAQGEACQPFAVCAGACADSVCCDSPCGGSDPGDCMACSVAAGAAKDGVCGPLACDDGNACTKPGVCAGGVCGPPGDLIACPAPQDACESAGVCNPATGTCSSPDTTECNDEGAPVVSKGSDYGPCQSPADCASGFCVDGLCCDSACDMPCRSCALPSSPGKCMQVPAFTDPRQQCLNTPNCKTTCGEEGTCIAATPGTQCAPSRCAGVDTPTQGLGPAYCPAEQEICPTGESIPFDCSPFICEPALGACRDRCTSVSHCAPGLLCDGEGMCVPKPPSKVGDAGGCGCRAAGGEERGAGWMEVLLVAAGLGLARRRLRSSTIGRIRQTMPG